jgi:hypothetical protein
MTTGWKEDSGGIKDELANYSILALLWWVSQEYGEDTRIILYTSPSSLLQKSTFKNVVTCSTTYVRFFVAHFAVFTLQRNRIVKSSDSVPQIRVTIKSKHEPNGVLERLTVAQLEPYFVSLLIVDCSGFLNNYALYRWQRICVAVKNALCMCAVLRNYINILYYFFWE